MKETQHYRGSLTAKMFDSHAHLCESRFAEEGQSPSDVLGRAADAGVLTVLIPGDSLKSSRDGIRYAIENNGLCGVSLYCSVGIHPHEASELDDEAEALLRVWLEHRIENRTVALGETGLDYFYDHSPREVQKRAFERQLDIAYEADIPVILHERDAASDIMSVLRRKADQGRLRGVPGVCHCCSCSPEIAKELLDMGFYLGFDGPITFKNNKKAPAVIAQTPLDRLLVETDAPFLTPEPNRGLRNEPEFIPYIVEKMAEIKGEDSNVIAAVTAENARRLFGIKGDTEDIT